MCKLTSVTGVAPSCWAPYLINGDAGDLSPEDIEQANQFTEWLGAVPVDCSDAGFRWTHDATRFGTLAADCQEYVALVPEES